MSRQAEIFWAFKVVLGSAIALGIVATVITMLDAWWCVEFVVVGGITLTIAQLLITGEL